jgi:hypothetical protein
LALIVVDQCEELYTLSSDEEAGRREENRRLFMDELLAASSRTGSKANVILTLRRLRRQSPCLSATERDMANTLYKKATSLQWHRNQRKNKRTRTGHSNISASSYQGAVRACVYGPTPLPTHGKSGPRAPAIAPLRA